MGRKEKALDLGIQDALEYTEHIIDPVHDPLIILFEDLRVALANRSFYRAFQVTAKETEGQFIFDLGDHQWGIPKLRQLLEDILSKNTSFDNYEIEHDFRHIGKRTMLMNACRIYLKDNCTRLIVLTIRDITEQREMDELRKKIRGLEAALKRSHTP